MQKRVYITRRLPETGVSLLKEKYQVDVFPEKRPIDRDLLLRKIRDCEALVSLLSDKIDDGVLSSANNLKIVANYAVGYDNIDIDSAKICDIRVTGLFTAGI